MADVTAATEALRVDWRYAATKAVRAMPRDVGWDDMQTMRVAADAAAEYVLEALDVPDVFVLEVRRVEVLGDPTLSIYRTTFSWQGKEQTGVFGTCAMLQAFLFGLRTVLLAGGYGALKLDWDDSGSWIEPPGVRWRIPRKGLASKELLRADEAAAVAT